MNSSYSRLSCIQICCHEPNIAETFAVYDMLTVFSNAIDAVFPKADIQNCIIHQLRNSSKYVSYQELKALMADLKKVYAAVDEPSAEERERFCLVLRHWGIYTKFESDPYTPCIKEVSFDSVHLFNFGLTVDISLGLLIRIIYHRPTIVHPILL